MTNAPPNEVSGLDIPPSRIDDAIAKVGGLVSDLMKNTGIPGLAVAIVRGGTTVYAKGFGVRDASKGDGQGNKVDADTVFQLASVSKSVGATVVAHEVTDNVIGWDTSVVSKLPWFALSDPYVTSHVTIADLYSHRSGLPDHAGDKLEDLGYGRTQTLERLKYLPLAPFRISHAYMAHWLTMVMANGTYDGQRITSPEALLPAFTPQVISTAAASPKARAGLYGYGFNTSVTSSGRTEYSHSGGFGSGAATNFAVLPSEDIGIIALTNAAPYGAPETLTAQFLDLVQYGQVREDWASLYNRALAPMNNPEGSLVGKQPPANPAPERPLRDYAGVYANDYWGPATVTESEGGLQLSLGPNHQTFNLNHWDGDTFRFTLTSENGPAGTISKAVFSGATLNLEYFDSDKLGTFTR